jgi:hypothetical protein
MVHWLAQGAEKARSTPPSAAGTTLVEASAGTGKTCAGIWVATVTDTAGLERRGLVLSSPKPLSNSLTGVLNGFWSPLWFPPLKKGGRSDSAA